LVFSYEVGALKPDKKIFEELIRKSQVAPGEIIYSDDSMERIRGAMDLRIRTFVYENFDQFCTELKRLGVTGD